MILDSVRKICYMCNCGFNNYYYQQNIVKINDELYYVNREKTPHYLNFNGCGETTPYMVQESTDYYKIHKLNVCFPKLKPKYVGKIFIPQSLDQLDNINEELFIQCPTK